MREQYNTAQRRAIIDCLLGAGGHMTASAVYAELAENGHRVSPATVYRQLEKLVDEGLAVKSRPVGEKSACFEIVDRSACMRTRCYHAKCTVCGRLIHLDCEKVDELCAHMLTDHGFRVDMSSTVLFGVCESCARRANDGKGRADA